MRIALRQIGGHIGLRLLAARAPEPLPLVGLCFQSHCPIVARAGPVVIGRFVLQLALQVVVNARRQTRR